MSIPLTCPNCDTSFSVAEELAGQRANCPGCKTPVSVAGDTSEDELDQVRRERVARTLDGGRRRGDPGRGRPAVRRAELLTRIGHWRTTWRPPSSAADAAVAAGEDLKVRLAEVERRTREADAGREDVQARLAAAERKADAAVAVRLEEKTQVTAPTPAAKDRPARKAGRSRLRTGRSGRLPRCRVVDMPRTGFGSTPSSAAHGRIGSLPRR